MLKYYNKLKFIPALLLLLSSFFLLPSCNKEFDSAGGEITPGGSGQTIKEIIDGNASYSILKAAITRAGLSAALNTEGATFTVFAPDDAAFAASGVSLALVNGMPLAQLTSILQYHVIPQTLPSAAIPTSFPNVQMPSLINLSAPFFKLSNFPSKRGAALYVNNIPVTQADIIAKNGVMHKVAALVSPPSLVLLQIIGADPDLAYFNAAIAKADEGSTGLSKFGGADGLLAYAPVNFTVFAPTNTAFQTALTGLIYNYLVNVLMVPPATALVQATALASTPAVFSNPALAAVLTPTTVKGILAYHMLGSRAFSVNLPSATTLISPTLLNGSISSHPGIKMRATFVGPVVTGFTLTSQVLTPGGVIDGPVANMVSKDGHAVNGIVHKIDGVLIPLPL